MINKTDIRVRLAQIVGELISEGYRKTGSIGDTVVALKHTNGNRMTIIANEVSIAFLKNGRLVKAEPLTIGAAAADGHAPATPST